MSSDRPDVVERVTIRPLATSASICEASREQRDALGSRRCRQRARHVLYIVERWWRHDAPADDPGNRRTSSRWYCAEHAWLRGAALVERMVS